MPPNIVANSSAITVSTRRAFFHSVGRKAITESLIASIPVRAAQPELKARISNTPPTAISAPPCSWAITRFCSTAGMEGNAPAQTFTPPATSRVNTAAMNT